MKRVVISGQKCTELFPLLNLSGSLAKMSEGLLHFQWYSRERLLTLETSGYQTVCFNIPACATNLKHERQRLWIVAHSESSRHRGGLSEERGTEGRLILRVNKEGVRWGVKLKDAVNYAGDRKDLDDPYSKGLQGQRKHFRLGGKQRKSESPKTSIQKNVSQTNSIRVFESNLGGKLSDGLSDRMDSEFGVPESQPKSKTRATRLKAIGNAVIPTIPEIIARAIIEAEVLKIVTYTMYLITLRTSRPLISKCIAWCLIIMRSVWLGKGC